MVSFTAGKNWFVAIHLTLLRDLLCLLQTHLVDGIFLAGSFSHICDLHLCKRLTANSEYLFI